MHTVTATETEDNLGARLMACRNKSGMTQNELALAVKSSQAVIQRIKTGKCAHPRNLESLAEVLGVSPAWLMYGTQDIRHELNEEAFAVAKAWSGLSKVQRALFKRRILDHLPQTEVQPASLMACSEANT